MYIKTIKFFVLMFPNPNMLQQVVEREGYFLMPKKK